MFIYNFFIKLLIYVLPLISRFSLKLNKGVKGRKETFSILRKAISPNDKTLWFHCASLGEYEQGLPVFKELKKAYPNHKIVLSFFSPSGFENKKNNPLTNITVYLPWDTKTNAQIFLNIIHPELTVFVKYELWPNILQALNNKNHKAILIAALFRKKQLFFKSYGRMYRKALFAFDHIFVQDKTSKQLLKTINYNSVTIAGDTRFDRVWQQLKMDNSLPFIETFKGDSLCVVVGSSWAEDEVLIANYINTNSLQNVKFIIAPHSLSEMRLKSLKTAINQEVVFFTQKEGKNLTAFNVLVLDTIGLLSKVYKYADIAYVGGAMGKTGLHNTLEAAVFGVPIIIGKNYSKFPEAIAMVNNYGMLSVNNASEFKKILSKLIENKDVRINLGSKNFNYVKKNTGSVIQILNYLRI